MKFECYCVVVFVVAIICLNIKLTDGKNNPRNFDSYFAVVK